MGKTIESKRPSKDLNLDQFSRKQSRLRVGTTEEGSSSKTKSLKHNRIVLSRKQKRKENNKTYRKTAKRPGKKLQGVEAVSSRGDWINCTQGDG